MTPADHDAYQRWAATARDSLDVARYNAAGGFAHAAVLHAEQAAQGGLNAVLRGVGGSPRVHDLLALAQACEREAGLVVEEGFREALGALARDYEPTRYPDALPGGTPREHYGPEAARRALTTAEQTLAAVTSRWEELQEAAGEPDEDEAGRQ